MLPFLYSSVLLFSPLSTIVLHVCYLIVSGGLSFVVIIVIIIVAFVVIVSIIVFVIWRWRRRHNSSSSKYAMAYLTNNENETVQLTGGEYAFSYGGEKDGGPSKQGEPA